MPIAKMAALARSITLGASGDDAEFLQRNPQHQLELPNHSAIVIVDQPVDELAFHGFPIGRFELVTSHRPPLMNAVSANQFAVPVKERRRLGASQEASALRAGLDTEQAQRTYELIQSVLYARHGRARMITEFV
jgi:hypothetical protein